MTKYLLLAVAYCIASLAYASNGSFVGGTDRSQVPVAVALEVAADYVAVPISISSNDKDTLRNIENVQVLMARIKAAAQKSGTIKLRQAAISLAINQGEEGGFSSFKTVGSSLSANLFLVAPFLNDRDVFAVAREIAALVQSIPKPEQTRLSIGTASLGVEAPERFRSRLLALMQRELEQVRTALGNTKSFEIKGLESPVIVTQRDDRNLTVYIPYTLKVGQ